MNREATNMERVTASIFRHGKANIEQVQADCPNLTRPQILKALHNASNRGYVHSAGVEMIVRADGRRRVAVYASGQRPPSKDEGCEAPRNGWQFGRVASVWDFGQGLTV